MPWTETNIAHLIEFATSSREVRTWIRFGPDAETVRDRAESALDREYPGAGIIGVRPLAREEIAALFLAPA